MIHFDGRLVRFVVTGGNGPILHARADRVARVVAIVVGADRHAEVAFIVGGQDVDGVHCISPQQTLLLDEADVKNWPALAKGAAVYLQQCGRENGHVQGCIMFREEAK